MLKTKSTLLNALSGKSVLVWGARMTGMGLQRLLRSHSNDILGFIDSDPAMQSKPVCGLEVFAPDSLQDIVKKHPDVCIIIAVSIKESEILEQLKSLGLANVETILYSDYCESFYTIDIMGSCNLKCPSCAHGAQTGKYPQGRMSKKSFEKVVDKIISENELVTHVSLYSWGEPMLHKDLPDFIRYLHSKNIAVALSSNISIDNDKLLAEVISLSPEYLKISLSGFYPEAYNRTHTGGDINLVKSNLYRLKYYIEKYKSHTFIDVNYHLYKDNNSLNLMKMQELCDELGFSLSSTYSLIMPLERCINHLEGNSDPKTVSLNQSLLVSVEEGVEATKNNKSDSCPFRENQININWDLTVPVCCTVFEQSGTTVAKDFLSVTTEQINKAKGKAEICKKCMAYGLPAYNMGFNKKRWAEIASEKISLDRQTK
ncbi:radical SAM protein [Pseudoalteromonas neustonica]|uniref:radical SAM protein n=1 Tax=Pseudoalteromonas neustonica TaxID=1840331 RepID=UPI0007DB4332|nr:radical SAM protein [Pseudoalteromonas neustonica]